MRDIPELLFFAGEQLVLRLATYIEFFRKPRMSAIGPKRTSGFASHMSAFGGKADMAFCGNSLSRSLLGVKRTYVFAAHMSAFDPKRTCPPV
jgi:hypothetical protein